MSTMHINPIHLVQSVSQSYDSKDSFSGGLSEELLAIAGRLREALEGLSAWVQIHALMRSEDEGAREGAAKDLNHLNRVFQDAHEELLSYAQQLPELLDSPAAYQMLKTIEKCFLEDAAKETPSEIPLYGFTSWGELILSTKEVKWTADMLQPIFEQVPAANWKSVRQILAYTKENLL